MSDCKICGREIEPGALYVEARLMHGDPAFGITLDEITPWPVHIECLGESAER